MLATQIQDIRVCVSLCHTDAERFLFDASLRLASQMCLRDNSKMHERCRTAVTSASFTPLATFRLQSFSTAAFLSVDVDITFHHITSQFSALALALLGVARRCSALLADLGVARSSRRCSQSQRAAIHGNQPQ